MKKLLALILALVMVMGLATVGTNAALVKYTDADSITEYFDEAIDVMSAIGVLEGADGQFRPTVQLKRSEAAKIVAYLNTNNKTAEGLVGSGKFTDVPTNHWAAGYIDYLASIGVIAGRSDTVFDPDGDLTVIDFAKMLLVVLGYDPQIEGLVGGDYRIHTSKLATDAGLFRGLNDVAPTATLNREQAALMAFNTIKGATVEYSNKGGSVSINGADIAFGASGFTYVTTTLAKDQNISDRRLTNVGSAADSGYTVEFGERQYPNLVLDDDHTDVFGRPINIWTYGKEDIGSYIDKETVIGKFTTSVTGADLVEMIGDAKIRNTKADDIHYYVNGEEIEYEPYLITDDYNQTSLNPFYQNSTNIQVDQMHLYAAAQENMIRSNRVAYAFTGNGVETCVFERGDELFITTILTYYVEATEDYNPNTGKVGYDVFTAPAAKGTGGAGDAVGEVAPRFNGLYVDNARISSADFDGVANLKKGDGFLARFYWDDVENKYDIGEITFNPDVKLAQDVTKYSTSAASRYTTITGLSSTDTTVDSFYGGYLVSGSQYDYSKAVFLDPYLRTYDDTQKALKPAYNLVFDEYGYLIAAFQTEVEDHYLFLTGVDTTTSNLAAGTAKGFAIFSDGTTATITVDLNDTNDNIDDFYDDKSTVGVVETLASYLASVKTVGNGATGTLDPDKLVYNHINNATGHAYNRWFTYTTTGEGSSAVYSLTPVKRAQIVSAANIGGYQAYDGTNREIILSAGRTRVVGDYINDYDENLATITNPELGVYLDNTYAVTDADVKNNKTSAWLNEGSTLITVKVGATQAHNAPRAEKETTISAVTGVYTGIQNTKLVAYEDMIASNEYPNGDWDVTNPFGAFAWTVYDGAQNIKYAIVMGRDAGASSNYLYATSNVTHERIEDGYYYWDFNAILDGEEKVLTLKSKYNTKQFNSLLGTNGITTGGNNDNALFKATFDKDGYVTALTSVAWTGDASKNDVYNNYQKGTEQSITDDFAVYNTFFNYGDTLYTANWTLWNEFDGVGNPYANGTDIGLAVLPNSPIYVIQSERTASSGGSGKTVTKYASLDAALGAVWGHSVVDGQPVQEWSQVGSRSRVNGFNGYVAAALDQGGRAKWVVIKSMNTANVQNTQNTTTPNTTSTNLTAVASLVGNVSTITINRLDGYDFTAGNISYKIYRVLSSGVSSVVQDGVIAAVPASTATISFNNGATGGADVDVDVEILAGEAYKVEITDKNGKTFTSNIVTAKTPV